MKTKYLSFKNHFLLGAIVTITIAFVIACGTSEAPPSTQVGQAAKIVPETQIVEVTKIIPKTQIVEVTRVVTRQQVASTQMIPAARIVQVTQVVPVTQVVQVIQVVPVTQIVEVYVPAATEAPIMPAPTEPPAATAPPAIPESNYDLLVWYDFENDFLSSGYVADRSGNGFDAQVYGTVAKDAGISDSRCIYFAGDSYIMAPVNPAGGRTRVSFSLWFKTEHPENNYKLASAAWWSGGPGSGWIMATHVPEFWSDDTLSLYVPEMVTNDNYFLSDEWIHEVVTYDGYRIKEYTNGQLVNNWGTTGKAIGQGQAMAVGAWPQFSGFNFEGNIDDFRIYSRSLTSQEVRSLYNQGP